MTTNFRYREIPLTKGKFAIVDASDYDFLMQWNWQTKNDGHLSYAYRSLHIPLTVGRVQKPLMMHKVLMPPPVGFEVDHINGNGLDNRKSNLRICKHQQNMWNRKSVSGSSSKFKGVSFQKATNYWKAYIKIDEKQKHIGCFLSEEEAAIAYNRVAKEMHGNFAKLNPVEDRECLTKLNPRW